MPNLKGYRTIIVNVLTIVALGGAAIINGPSNLSPQFLVYAGMAVAVANIALRVITNTPIFTSAPPAALAPPTPPASKS